MGAVVISYRIEVGAVLLAVAASGLVGMGQRARRSRGRRGSARPGAAGVLAVAALLVAGGIGGIVLAGAGGSATADTVRRHRARPERARLWQRCVRSAIRGRAPKTGYSRAQFGPAWEDVDHNGCDTRDDILRRDLTDIRVRGSTHGCVVIAGELADPYTGKRIVFTKSAAAKVQIDHVVALSDAWQTGAQSWSATTRLDFANDPLELLAVDGDANQQKGDGDAATWLPPQKAFRCAYVSRQVAVKLRYHLWVTPAEREAIARVLQSCPDEVLP